MDFFIFVLISLGWITSLFFYLEKKTEIRTMFLAMFSLLLGTSLMITGIDFPTGWTIITSGSTQTISQTVTSYTSSNNPWILGIAWILVFAGLYFIIEIWTSIITTLGSGISAVRGKFGL